MAHRTVRELLARARKTPGKLVLLDLKLPDLQLSDLKLFAEGTGYGRGIVIYAVSPDFRKKSLTERNELVWELLDEELDDQELQQISHLFTFTPKEFKPGVRKAVAVH